MEVGMSCGKVDAEKQPFSGYLSSRGICDLGILRPTCCASLQGVCISLPALSTQNSWVIPQKVNEDGDFFFFKKTCWVCCHVYELLGPSVLPISRFYLQVRIGNLFLWYMFFFCTEPRFGWVTCLQVLGLPGSTSCCKTWDGLQEYAVLLVQGGLFIQHPLGHLSIKCSWISLFFPQRLGWVGGWFLISFNMVFENMIFCEFYV